MLSTLIRDTYASTVNQRELHSSGKCCSQAVQARCREVAKGGKVEVLALDLTAPYSELQAAAALSDGAFGGAGIDYLVHNAGVPHTCMHTAQGFCILGC